MAVIDYPIKIITVAEREYVAESLTGERQVRAQVLAGLIRRVREQLQRADQTLVVEGYQPYLGIESLEQRYHLLRAANGARTPLRQYLESEETEVGQVLEWLARLVAIYQEAEAKGVEWPGLIPESIWISDEGRLEVVDPLVTSLVRDYRDELQLPWHEEELLPPEVTRRKGWTGQGRMYALGIWTYRLICGTSPFAAENQADLLEEIREGRLVQPRVANPELSAAINGLLVKLLATNPEKRFCTWDEVAEALEEVLVAQDFVAPQDEVAEYRERREKVYRQHYRKSEVQRWFKRYWKVLGVGLILLLAAAFAFTQSGGPTLPTLTAETPPEEIVAYYYQGIQQRNTTLIEKIALEQEVKELVTWLDEIYAIEKVSSAYSAQSPELMMLGRSEAPGEAQSADPGTSSSSTAEDSVGAGPSSSSVAEGDQRGRMDMRLFVIRNLKYELLEAGETLTYQATYQLVLRKPQGAEITDRVDRLVLGRGEEHWQIIDLETRLGQ